MRRASASECPKRLGIDDRGVDRFQARALPGVAWCHRGEIGPGRADRTCPTDRGPQSGRVWSRSERVLQRMTRSVQSESTHEHSRRSNGQHPRPPRSSQSATTSQAPARSLDRDAASNRTSKEPSGWRARLDQWLERVDDFQQGHRFVSIPLAVWRKFSDDDGGKLASLISYYAFISIFPLLIVLATVASRVLANDPAAADAFVQSAAGSFLSIGSDDSGTIKPLDVAGPHSRSRALVALWSGLAVANAIQDAANVVYEVPKTQRPGLLPRILRSITLLILVGIGLPATTALQGLAGKLLPGLRPPSSAGCWSSLRTPACIILAFARATVAQTAWRTLVPGALVAAVAWSLAQELGTDLLTRRVAGAQQTYGSFALVIGILFWFFVLAQITLYCCELNVVLQDKLWPRSLRAILQREAETEADVKAYTQYPQREKQAHNIEVAVESPKWADRTRGSTSLRMG